MKKRKKVLVVIITYNDENFIINVINNNRKTEINRYEIVNIYHYLDLLLNLNVETKNVFFDSIIALHSIHEPFLEVYET